MRKHSAKIIILYVLLFASSFGETVETLMQQGSDYDYSMGYGLLLTLANIGLISLIMMAVPLIYTFVKKDKLAYKTGKRLCLWNSIILFILSCLSSIFASIPFIGGVGAIMFYFINKWLYVVDKEDAVAIEKTPEEKPAQEQKTPYKEATITTTQVAPAPVSQSITVQQPKLAKPSVKYCSRCGKPIDSVTKKCTGCGKQYFKGISLKAVLIGILVFCLTLSLVLNIVFVIKLQQKPAYVVPDTEEDFSSWLEKQALKDKANFMDTYIVLVEDDGTELYHKYGCTRFKGESFWAFNIDAAKDNGYNPCSLCCD